MEWRRAAERLADEVTHTYSRWRQAVTDTPRHVFVPRWFEQQPGAGWDWSMRAADGPSDPDRWCAAAYTDRTLITQLGTVHADDADDQVVTGQQPTSSGTNPSTVVAMLRHARVYDGADVLDVATGTGYSAALLAHRLGDKRVTSIDVDAGLVERAAARLDVIGLHPTLAAVDATGPIAGEYDRIIAMVSVRPVPASWLATLRPGGRFVAAISGTTLLLTAEATGDGGAVGRIEPEAGGFMSTRHGSAYAPAAVGWEKIREAGGEEVGRGRMPLWSIPGNSDVASLLELRVPGIRCHHERGSDRRSLTVWLAHDDGSWARATAAHGDVPDVHQSGPRRLWDEYDQVRAVWNMWGTNPALGARATIDPDGTIHLDNSGWTTTIS